MQQGFFQLIIPLGLTPILLLVLWRIRLKKLAAYPSSSLGKIEVWEKYNGEKVLTINSYPQGVSINDKSIKKSYWFSIAESVIKFCQGKQNAQVLMLGLGANTIPNLIAKSNSKIFQTLVEIDQDVIRICQDFFGLNSLPSYKLIQADAFKLISSKDPFGKKFDVIIVDIFTGEPPYVSLDSNQPNFIEQLLPFLKKEGMVIFNRPAHNEKTRADGVELKEYLQTLFRRTQIFDIQDPRRFRNHVIAASKLKRQ